MPHTAQTSPRRKVIDDAEPVLTDPPPHRAQRAAGALHSTGFVLYDEQCRLCTAWMEFVVKHNRHHKLVFVPVNSWIGSRLLRSANMTTATYDSIIYARAPHIYLHSEAIIRILMTMGFPWRFAQALLLVPVRWRDRIYKTITRNRYRWFGKHRACACGTLHRNKQFTGHHAI